MSPEPTDLRTWPALPIFPLVGLGVVLLGLITGGGGNAVSASALAFAMVATLIGAVVTARPRHLGRAMQDNALSLAAFFGLVVWSLLTVVPVPVELAHPLFGAMGLERGTLSIAPHRTLEGIVSLFGPAAAFGLGALAIRGRRDRKALGLVLVGSGIAFCLFALGDYAASITQSGFRLDANLASANAAATVAGLYALIAGASLARASRAGPPRAGQSGFFAAVRQVLQAPASLGLFVLALAVLLLSASRGGTVAFGAGLVFLLGLVSIGSSGGALGGRFAGVGQSLLMVLLIGLTVTAFGSQLVLERFAETSGLEGAHRATLIATHWGAFLDRPLLGHGLNSFHSLNAYYATLENWTAIQDVGSAHNVVVQALEETGVLGFLLFALMIGGPSVRSAFLALRGRSGAIWAALAVAAGVLVLSHGMVDFGLNIPAVAALYAFLLGAYSRQRLSGA